jgi:hypothetical protein
MDPRPRLADSAVVLRLVPQVPSHYPPDAPKPLPAAFDLSDDDRAEATRRQLPAGASVFDLAKTSVAEARGIRNSASLVVPFAICVGAVHTVGAQYADRLSVVSDPLTQDVPGGAGHAAITGLLRQPGEERASFKTLKQLLVDKCFLVGEDGSRK